MGTFRRVLIKNVDKTVIAELIKKHYPIGRTSVLDYEYREIFLDISNYVIIVFDAYVSGWTEIEFDFNKSIEEHDHFLTQISKIFNTTVIFLYEQTTTGDTRFLVIRNGDIVRSIYQKTQSESYGILMAHDIGERLDTEKHFVYPPTGQSLEEFTFLDMDIIQKMSVDAGYVGESREVFDEQYLHFEYLKSEGVFQ
jgi:hypothetical protein